MMHDGKRHTRVCRTLEVTRSTIVVGVFIAHIKVVAEVNIVDIDRRDIATRRQSARSLTC